jgi:Rad3-related DNA helicase
MQFDLETRTAALSVGEFASFQPGPREGDGGPAGLWRAQLGTHWHRELQARATAEFGALARFEITLSGRVTHRGWTLTLTGRVDQLIRERDSAVLREIKSVLRPLPAEEAELRREHPDYFAQAAAYAALARQGAFSAETPDLPLGAFRTQLVFVEADSGLAQTIALTPADDAAFLVQLERIVEFLTLRRTARDHRLRLRFRPAFAVPRPGQETTLHDLTTTFERHPLVLFEAPTGFGKTGVLAEFALGQLRAGHCDRVIYLTSKATGQLQVVRTLDGMTHPLPGEENASTPVAVWTVRNKSEHCINTVLHCVREKCAYLDDHARRWSTGGLARFYLDPHHARDIDTLRAAGRNAGVCPYEITRRSLAQHDVWVGDYNYVFSPRNRAFFFDQPGFDPARTLLLIDEAHNLPARVADVLSHELNADAADNVLSALHRVRCPRNFSQAWDHWTHFLRNLEVIDSLDLAAEDDARHLLRDVATLLQSTALNFAELGPEITEVLWHTSAVAEDVTHGDLPRLWWVPRRGQLACTCLDAAATIGPQLREFGGVVLASATLTPFEDFAAACGLVGDHGAPTAPIRVPSQPQPEKLGALTKRDTRKLFRQLATGADLLRREGARDAAAPALVPATAPWREGSYDVAFDQRVDTRYMQRDQHHPTTAATVAALHQAATRHGPPNAAVVVFFSSYAYAERIQSEAASAAPRLKISLQPRIRELTAQSAWIESALAQGGALFLVLGSSFAESVDLLGGRISHAMVVGPALPEVNAVQQARIRECRAPDRAFRQVYQIPGMNKVNQALGRLVRAPGHRTSVLLHCQRFADTEYRGLLAPEYRHGKTIATDSELTAWLEAD